MSLFQCVFSKTCWIKANADLSFCCSWNKFYIDHVHIWHCFSYRGETHLLQSLRLLLLPLQTPHMQTNKQTNRLISLDTRNPALIWALFLNLHVHRLKQHPNRSLKQSVIWFFSPQEWLRKRGFLKHVTALST